MSLTSISDGMRLCFGRQPRDRCTATAVTRLNVGSVGRTIARVAGVFLLVLIAARVHAQQQTIPGKVKGFKVPVEFYGPPNQAQMKTLVQGAEAQPQPGGRLSVLEARVQTFHPDGSTELLVTTPECMYDAASKSITSERSIEAQTGDGRFRMSGERFIWRQTNSSLTILSRVQTEVQSGALSTGGKPAGADLHTPDRLKITSDEFNFEYETGDGSYLGQVKVAGTNLNLTSGRLSLKVPGRKPQLESITVDQDVVLDYALGPAGWLHATGQHAVWQADTGLLHVEGAPAWTMGERQGKADEFVIDPTNKVLRATGNAWLKGPGGQFGTKAITGGQPSGSQAAETNDTVEIASSQYEMRTNHASFRGPVRVSARSGEVLRGTMDCSSLEVGFVGTNSLQRLEARENVVIAQEENRFDADLAVYETDTGWLELTGSPAWKSGPRSGKGNSIRLGGPENAMEVVGNASLRFPASELSLAELGLGTNRPVATADSFADVFANRYTLKRESASFAGGVYISHPNLSWSSENLIMDFDPADRKVTRVNSGERVSFDFMDARGRRVSGAGDIAVYTYEASAAATNEIIHLSGAPCRLQSVEPAGKTNGTLRSPTLVVDVTRRKFIVPPGTWDIRGTGPALPTNTFKMPSRFPSRKK